MGQLSVSSRSGERSVFKETGISLPIQRRAERTGCVGIPGRGQGAGSVYTGTYGGGKDAVHRIPGAEGHGREPCGEALLPDRQDHYQEGGGGDLCPS